MNLATLSAREPAQRGASPNKPTGSYNDTNRLITNNAVGRRRILSTVRHLRTTNPGAHVVIMGLLGPRTQ
jgi:hypothetical protein